jgi:hypothetical protein
LEGISLLYDSHEKDSISFDSGSQCESEWYLGGTMQQLNTSLEIRYLQDEDWVYLQIPEGLYLELDQKRSHATEVAGEEVLQ